MALLNNTPQQYYNNEIFGGYQFVSLKDIINQFMLIYVGEDKLITKTKRLDVAKRTIYINSSSTTRLRELY